MNELAISNGNSLINRIASEEHINPSGIDMLGGKTYINTSGLDTKIKNKCKDEHLIFAGVSLEETIAITTQTMRQGFKATIKFFDKEGFQESIKAISDMNSDMLQMLIETYSYSFEDIGIASPQTLQMASMKIFDNIVMMASRRATNRAKRAATGCGLTSTEEMNTSTNGNYIDSEVVPEPSQASPAAVEQKTANPPKQDKPVTEKTDADRKKEIMNSLSYLYGDDEEARRQGLIEASTFPDKKTGNIVAGKDTMIGMKTKQLQAIRNKLKTLVNKKHKEEEKILDEVQQNSQETTEDSIENQDDNATEGRPF